MVGLTKDQHNGACRILLVAFILIVMWLVSSTVNAAASVRSVRAVASGSDRDSAISNALADALRQVHGGEISMTRETQRTLHRLSTNGSSSIRSEQRGSSVTRTSSEGLINGYRIVSLTPLGYGGFDATLDVDIPVYQTQAVHSARRKIAVYPVETVATRYRFGGQTLNAVDVSQRLTQSLVAATVQSGRFSVLDRDMRSGITREQHFIGGDDVPLAEKMALGRALGAELLLVSRLRRLDLETVQHRNPLSGEVSQSSQGAAVIEARVVMPSTGQLMWAKTLELGASEIDVQSSEQAMLASVSRELVSSVLEGIYPLRVVDGLGDSAVINQGGELVQLGQRYDVFSIGRRYADPYSGESLGAREKRVASVEVTFVGAKTSQVRVLDGTVTGDGHVLRRVPGLAASRPYQPSAQKKTSTPARSHRRGFCLPGDAC
ncbi:CsgG/HfaB family protein [Granulosicoccus antarcticus]|uniref:Uncharacterized protein n=1 Tax=Granulosicoccus antarcticus IMCC3135 TaxID=1192854 RepID=A0A2Z2P9V0_9GAMM|nr:CsgG/HfaB family protein [Granulosicoccus antarcticus]ASJ76664.1 hypothetical protein IMCC3135_33100 [Granulosicoccus antarcticus IMCC3135]